MFFTKFTKMQFWNDSKAIFGTEDIEHNTYEIQL